MRPLRHRALPCGPSTSPLEARLASPRTQLRVVAIFYAVLAIWSLRRAVWLVILMPRSCPHEFTCTIASATLWRASSDPLFASALRIYLSFAAVTGALATLSLRYLALKSKWRALTLVGSGLFALGAVYVVGTAPGRPITRSEIPDLMAVWGLVLACLLCALFLWRHLRASNNRIWTPPASGRDNQG